MKKAILLAMAGFLIFGVAVTLSRWNVPEADTAGLKTYYGTIIDRVIIECLQKSGHRSGRFERASIFNCFKATYFKLRRRGLIVELMEKKIGKSEFLARYHLNRSFYQAIRDLPPQVMSDAL